MKYTVKFSLAYEPDYPRKEIVGAAHQYAYVPSELIDRLKKSPVVRTYGEQVYFEEADFFHPDVQSTLHALRGLGWYPADHDAPADAAASGKRYSFFYSVSYEPDELAAFEYLQISPRLSVKNNMDRERYEDGFPLISARDITDQCLFYRLTWNTSFFIVHPRILAALREAGLCRRLEVHPVAYIGTPAFELYWLSSDLVLPMAGNWWINTYDRLTDDGKRDFRDGYLGHYFDQNLTFGGRIRFAAGDLRPCEPFDFAYTHEQVGGKGKAPNSYRKIIVSGAVYRLFRRKGWDELCRWKPVVVHPDADRPPLSGYGDMQAHMAPFLPGGGA